MDLTVEQEAHLACIEARAKEMSKEDLIDALITAEANRIHQVSTLSAAIYRVGGSVSMASHACLEAPETEEELIEIFGCYPDEDAYWDYVSYLEEHATMGVDLEEIVLEDCYDLDELEEQREWRS